MKSFTDLEAWKVGMQMVCEVYRITGSFPASERFGLTAQLRKASGSILANLAEGFGRSSAGDKAYKYTIARGECTEANALLLIAIALKYLSKETAQNALTLASHTGKLLSGLIHKYSPPSPSPSPSP